MAVLDSVTVTMEATGEVPTPAPTPAVSKLPLIIIGGMVVGGGVLYGITEAQKKQ